MKANIYSYKRLIGETNLHIDEVSIGKLYGSIALTETAPKSINIQLENGMFLYTHGNCKFNNNEGRIEITGVDYKIIEDFILTNSPRPFVEEPWHCLTIEQKILFEEELRKELPPQHILLDSEVSAVCVSNDDVLFEIKKPELVKQFALVHLTWRGKKESPGFPGTEFYTDFDEFKLLRMYPDKAEWEY